MEWPNIYIIVLILEGRKRKYKAILTSRYEQLDSSDSSSQSILELHLLARGMQSPGNGGKYYTRCHATKYFNIKMSGLVKFMLINSAKLHFTLNKKVLFYMNSHVVVMLSIMTL